MAMRKIKKGDKVVLLSGKSKGLEGKVLSVINKAATKSRAATVKVLVEGANLVKKHVKPNPQAGEKGGILEREAAIDASNVALATTTKKEKGAKIHSKVYIKKLQDGKKVRCLKVNEEIVDV